MQGTAAFLTAAAEACIICHTSHHMLGVKQQQYCRRSIETSPSHLRSSSSTRCSSMHKHVLSRQISTSSGGGEHAQTSHGIHKTAQQDMLRHQTAQESAEQWPVCNIQYHRSKEPLAYSNTIISQPGALLLTSVPVHHSAARNPKAGATS